MDFVDSAGTRYQLVESAEAPAHATKTPVWPWVVSAVVVTGGLCWIASMSHRKSNPIDPRIDALILEARDPNTPKKRLIELISQPNEEVRRALLDNPNLCYLNDDGQLQCALLGELATDFPEKAAAHPAFLLHALIETAPEMKWPVAEVLFRSTNAGLIERLLTTWGPSSTFIRMSAAQNPNTPENVLRVLGNHKFESSWKVRNGVASNLSTPIEVLLQLSNEATESDERVREAAQKALAKRGLT